MFSIFFMVQSCKMTHLINFSIFSSLFILLAYSFSKLSLMILCISVVSIANFLLISDFIYLCLLTFFIQGVWLNVYLFCLSFQKLAFNFIKIFLLCFLVSMSFIFAWIIVISSLILNLAYVFSSFSICFSHKVRLFI